MSECITHGLLAMGLEDANRIYTPTAGQPQKSCTLCSKLTIETYIDCCKVFGKRDAHTGTASIMVWVDIWAPDYRTRAIYRTLSELTEIADEALRTAKDNKLKAQKIDLFILKLWGQTSPLKDITLNDLAKVTRSVIELNGLYDETHFDL